LEAEMADISLAGNWAYRSYQNTQDQPVFGAGTFTFTAPSPDKIQGTLDMGNDLVLDLDGTVTAAPADAPLTVHIIGNGRPYTKTAGWEYDYHGFLGYMWPNGIDQVPSLVGTIVRAKPHDGRPAGVTASFIAVKLT
jgi:hypothetical protein